jgi:hypothetical protein
MNIIYYGLSKAYVEQARDWLAQVNQYPTFTHAGNTIMALTLKSALKKPDVVLALLTESEYDKAVLNNTNKFKNVKLDKVFVVNTLEDLKGKLEELFGVKLGVEEEVQEDPVVEEATVHEEVQDEASVEEDFDTGVLKDEKEVEEVEQVVEVPKKEVRGISKLAIIELKEEIASLKREKEELELKLATGDGVNVTKYEEKIENLELVIREKDREITKLHDDINDLKQSVEELETSILAKDKEIRDVKLGIFKKEMVKVPDDVEFYVAASGVSLMHAYEYLLTENEEGLIVDLSRESFVDVFVKLNSPIRPDKWLVDGINIRAAFTAYDLKSTYDVSPELRLITAPSYTLPLGIYRDVNWEVRFKEALKLGMPVMFFLGDISQEGVIDFANRLEGVEINVLRRENKLDLRAYNKAKKYLANASEVLMRGDS